MPCIPFRYPMAYWDSYVAARAGRAAWQVVAARRPITSVTMRSVPENPATGTRVKVTRMRSARTITTALSMLLNRSAPTAIARALRIYDSASEFIASHTQQPVANGPPPIAQALRSGATLTH